MKIFSTKANAKRAAIREIAKGENLEPEVVKASLDQYATIEKNEEGAFFWRRIQTAQPEQSAPNKKATEDLDEGNSRRKMKYNKAGDAIPAEEKEEKHNEVADKEDTPLVRASSIENPCKVVWDMAEKMKGERRKDIVQACVDAGIAYHTARTQYQAWFKANK